MASLADTFDSIRAEGGAFHLAAPPAWSQGRTLYGGMTAALCFEAALRLLDTDIPLRSMRYLTRVILQVPLASHCAAS